MVERKEYITEYVIVYNYKELYRTRDFDTAREIAVDLARQHAEYRKAYSKSKPIDVRVCEEEVKSKGLRYTKPVDIIKS